MVSLKSSIIFGSMSSHSDASGSATWNNARCNQSVYEQSNNGCCKRNNVYKCLLSYFYRVHSAIDLCFRCYDCVVYCSFNEKMDKTFRR